MAEASEDQEKTEDPTQKRLDDAKRDGDVAKSQEINSWFIMLAMTIFIIAMSQSFAYDLSNLLKGFIANAHDIPVDNGGLRRLFNAVGMQVLIIMALPLLLLVIAGLAGNLVQHGFIFSTKQVEPKLSKISPLSGLKRLFSATTAMNFLKSMLKLVLVTAVIIMVIWPQRDALESLIPLEPLAMLVITHTMASQILVAVLLLFTVIAGLDYAYQRQTWWQKHKMTKQEVRQEHKQMEGDPQIKAKIRQIRQERGRKRMLANVPQASVVITNPTHYSIALKYEPGMSAPICLAKGVDNIALKIREVAKDNEIPVVENPPLARSLYATVEIDEEIPEEHYKAVAEVIGYVMRLRQRTNKR